LLAYCHIHRVTADWLAAGFPIRLAVVCLWSSAEGGIAGLSPSNRSHLHRSTVRPLLAPLICL